MAGEVQAQPGAGEEGLVAPGAGKRVRGARVHEAHMLTSTLVVCQDNHFISSLNRWEPLKW